MYLLDIGCDRWDKEGNASFFAYHFIPLVGETFVDNNVILTSNCLWDTTWIKGDEKQNATHIKIFLKENLWEACCLLQDRGMSFKKLRDFVKDNSHCWVNNNHWVIRELIYKPHKYGTLSPINAVIPLVFVIQIILFPLSIFKHPYVVSSMRYLITIALHGLTKLHILSQLFNFLFRDIRMIFFVFYQVY